MKIVLINLHENDKFNENKVFFFIFEISELVFPFIKVLFFDTMIHQCVVLFIFQIMPITITLL